MNGIEFMLGFLAGAFTVFVVGWAVEKANDKGEM